jgi:molybdenum cofactor guanylyltransferase
MMHGSNGSPGSSDRLIKGQGVLEDLDKERITAIILAGGRGRRMGGTDKGLVEFAGQPLVVQVARQIAPQVGMLLVSVNRNQTAYEDLGFRTISDELRDYQGPLAGFASALRAADSEWLMFVPCDAPCPAADMAERLFRAATAGDADIAVAHDGARMQPVHALLNRALRPDLERFLDTGGRKIDLWYARHRVEIVDFGDRQSSFENINTPQQKDAMEAALSRHA